jgi:uroporphyrin-III C-methyltransferase
MGVATADAFAEKLIADGLTPDMPVAVIENACRPEMRVMRAQLAELGALVAAQRVRSPALIVIGTVATRGHDQALARLAEAIA